MAIQDIIQTIREAVYGEEMREAIAEGFEEVSLASSPQIISPMLMCTDGSAFTGYDTSGSGHYIQTGGLVFIVGSVRADRNTLANIVVGKDLKIAGIPNIPSYAPDAVVSLTPVVGFDSDQLLYPVSTVSQDGIPLKFINFGCGNILPYKTKSNLPPTLILNFLVNFKA